jgi:hypothetical protein
MHIKDKIYTCKNCGNNFPFKGYSDTHTYCNLKCAYEYRVKGKDELFEERYNLWLAGGDLGLKNPRGLIRKFIIKRDGYNCSCCGINSWNGKELTLWADHIDGDASNDHPSNYRLICPNCDSQSSTFGAKNYGKGRKARGLPQYG